MRLEILKKINLFKLQNPLSIYMRRKIKEDINIFMENERKMYLKKIL